MTLASKTFQALMGTKKRMVTRGNAFAALMTEDKNKMEPRLPTISKGRGELIGPCWFRPASPVGIAGQNVMRVDHHVATASPSVSSG